MEYVPSTSGFCPHCGARIASYNPNRRYYGSPIKICKKCGEKYFDRSFHEIAAEGMPASEFSYGRDKKMGLLGLTFFVLAYTLLYFEKHYQQYYHTSWYMIMILSGAIMLIAVIDAVQIKTGSKEKRFRKLMQESEERLENYEYAKQLKELGYSVPEKYLCEKL